MLPFSSLIGAVFTAVDNVGFPLLIQLNAMMYRMENFVEEHQRLTAKAAELQAQAEPIQEAIESVAASLAAIVRSLTTTAADAELMHRIEVLVHLVSAHYLAELALPGEASQTSRLAEIFGDVGESELFFRFLDVFMSGIEKLTLDDYSDITEGPIANLDEAQIDALDTRLAQLRASADLSSS